MKRGQTQKQAMCMKAILMLHVYCTVCVSHRPLLSIDEDLTAGDVDSVPCQSQTQLVRSWGVGTWGRKWMSWQKILYVWWSGFLKHWWWYIGHDSMDYNHAVVHHGDWFSTFIAAISIRLYCSFDFLSICWYSHLPLLNAFAAVKKTDWYISISCER